MAERHMCRQCAAEAEPGLPLCEACFLARAQLQVAAAGRKLEFEAAIEEAKLAVLN
jgi:hypothetical protein